MEVASIDARIAQVTVYSRGARIRRSITVSGPGILPQQIRITGLPLAVIDDTVRIELEGTAIATTVRTGIDAPTESAASEDPPELRSAKRRYAIAQAEAERIAGAIERTSSSSIIEQDPSDEPPAPWAAIVTARRAVIAVHSEREHVLRGALAAAQREVDDARRGLEAAADRDRRTGTARPAKQHELRKYLDVELTGATGSSITLHLEYLVAAARWAPSYVARLDGERVSVEVRAVVAQDSGEDWTGVPLRLSTAEPTQFAPLPELAAQRIGRRQQEPGRTGFRAAPIGAEGLYADYLRDVLPLRQHVHELSSELARESRSKAGEATTVKIGQDDYAPDSMVEQDEGAVRRRVTTLAEEVWDDASSDAKEAFETPASGRMMPQSPAPMDRASATRSVPEANRMKAPEAKKLLAYRGAVGGAGMAVDKTVAPPAAPVAQLDYANLVMSSPASALRGRLVRAPDDRNRNVIGESVHSAVAKLAGLALPRGCIADWSHAYDYAFATDGTVDVRADGAWHSIAVTARETSARAHHVAVPREQPDVFRVVAIANPFAGPLLPGPIDVYDRGRFLVTSSVDYTPPAATVDIGLGVDAAIKIARNTEFREEATGMLRGALRLHHTITIDVDNVSGRSIELEVRERIPVTRKGDDDIEVTLGKVEPVWERWTPDPDRNKDDRLRGGQRWRLVVPAGQKRTLRAAYEVKIAGKSELVGGNRREP